MRSMRFRGLHGVRSLAPVITSGICVTLHQPADRTMRMIEFNVVLRQFRRLQSPLCTF